MVPLLQIHPGQILTQLSFGKKKSQRNASENLYKWMLKKKVSQTIWSTLRAIENCIFQLSHAYATTGFSKLQVLRVFF